MFYLTRHYFNLRKISLIISFFLVFIASFGCGNNKQATDNNPVTKEAMAQLIVDKIAVAVVPGAWEAITVTALDKDGKDETWSVESEDTNIAQVTVADNQITAKGVNFGDTILALKSASGVERNIPIKVYSPLYLDVGDFIIGFTDQFTYRWNDSGSGGTYDGSFWHPVVPDSSWHALGSIGFPGYYNPNGRRWALILKEKEGSTALMQPIDYDQEYTDSGSGADDDGSFWTPICPEGYVAMGSVAQSGWSDPSLSDVVCVRENLTKQGEVGDFVWNDHDTGASSYMGAWQITIPDISLHEKAYIETGTFITQGNVLDIQRFCTGGDCWTAPYSHPVMNVLAVDLPMLIDTPEESRIPELTGYDQPPVTSAPSMVKAMLVPFPAMLGGEDISNAEISWLVENSPFLRVERYVYNDVIFHTINNTSLTQENSLELVSGISTTNSETLSHTVGVSITTEGGVEFMGFSGKTSVTVSYEFGYETMHSVTQLEEKHINVTAYTPPGTATACWQQRNKYRIQRHNGTQRDTIAETKFGIDTYVVDQYPD